MAHTYSLCHSMATFIKWSFVMLIHIEKLSWLGEFINYLGVFLADNFKCFFEVILPEPGWSSCTTLRYQKADRENWKPKGNEFNHINW